MAEQRMMEVVSKLAYLSAESFVMDDLLHQLCDVAAASLGVDGVAVLACEQGRSRFVHAGRRPDAPKMQRWQDVLADGPGREVMTHQRRLVAMGAGELAQWPALAGHAGQLGVRGVIAVPLLKHGRCWGVLYLWTCKAVSGDALVPAAQLLADVAVSYVAMVDGHRQADTAHARLADRLLRDSLTGLANREVMHELLSHALALAARHRTSVAALFVDVDDFKHINDTYGHDAGDTVLREVAGRLRRAARDSDSVGRVGGDEFVVACEDLNGPAPDVMLDMWSLAGRLLAAVSEPILLPGQPAGVRVSVSIGIAITSGKRQVPEVLASADAAMYEAKNGGGGKICVRHLDVQRIPAPFRPPLQRTAEGS